jgi:hypothetical protein
LLIETFFLNRFGCVVVDGELNEGVDHGWKAVWQRLLGTHAEASKSQRAKKAMAHQPKSEKEITVGRSHGRRLDILLTHKHCCFHKYSVEVVVLSVDKPAGGSECVGSTQVGKHQLSCSLLGSSQAPDTNNGNVSPFLFFLNLLKKTQKLTNSNKYRHTLSTSASAD